MACTSINVLGVTDKNCPCPLSPAPKPGQIVMFVNGQATWVDPAISPLKLNPDGSFTYTDENGQTVTIPAATVTNTVAGHVIATYTNSAGAAVDIKETITAVTNALASGHAIGTYTNEAGAATVINETVIGVVNNPDGTTKITNEDGATTTIGHPPANLTNNVAPFAWNAATQVGNIPKEPTLVANGDGSYTYTPGDGTAPVTISVPSDIFLQSANYNDATNILTLTLTDGSTFPVNLTDLVDPDIVTTITGTVAGHAIGTYTNEAGAATVINETVIGVVDNGNRTYTITNEDGVAVTIDASCCTAANTPYTGTGMLAEHTNVQSALDEIGAVDKVVINPGAGLPIADVTDAGAQDLWNAGNLFQMAETEDIIPTVGADGVTRWYYRQIAGMVRYQDTATITVPPATWTPVRFVSTEYLDPGLAYNPATGEFTVAVAGDYEVNTVVSWRNGQNWVVDGSGHPDGFVTSLALFKNGSYWVHLSENDHYGIGNNTAFRDQGSHTVRLNAGDRVGVQVVHLQPGTMVLEDAQQPPMTNYIQITRVA